VRGAAAAAAAREETRESEQELEAPALRVREGRDLILMDLVTGPTRRAAYTWLSA
jgi:hypothetical protein